MVVDAHQHFWTLHKFTTAFPDATQRPIFRDFLPEHLEPLAIEAGVDGTITVQAAPTLEESEWLLHLTADNPLILGVVGWANLDQPEPTFDRDLARLAAYPKLVGLRPMLQDLSADDFIMRPRVIANLNTLADHGLRLDLLIYDRHVPAVIRALDHVPHLLSVVDHAAKPPIQSGGFEPWASRLAELARHSGVWCKISGLVTEADHTQWTAGTLQPYVDHAAQVFGSERLLAGSDWPVCLQAGSYTQVLDVARAVLESALGGAAQEAVWGANALAFYHLEGRYSDRAAALR